MEEKILELLKEGFTQNEISRKLNISRSYVKKIGVKNNVIIMPRNEMYEKGYSYWKNGYANEAIKALIEVAFDYYNVNVIEAKYLLENIASKNLLKKNEFIIDEIIKDGFIKNNRKYDLVKCYKSKL